MDRPFRTVTNQYLEVFKRINETLKFQFEYYDNFVLGIIGFSVAGITLIISNIEKLYPLLRVDSIFWILSLLTISVISGILYRMFFFGLRFHFLNSYGFIEAAFFEQEQMNYNAEELSENTPVNELVKKLKDYFDIDQSEFVKSLGELSEVDEKALKKTLLNRYNLDRKWAKKDFYLGHIFARDSLFKAFDINKKQYKKFMASVKKYDFFFYAEFTKWLLIISTLSFVIATLVFVIFFFISN